MRIRVVLQSFAFVGVPLAAMSAAGAALLGAPRRDLPFITLPAWVIALCVAQLWTARSALEDSCRTEGPPPRAVGPVHQFIAGSAFVAAVTGIIAGAALGSRVGAAVGFGTLGAVVIGDWVVRRRKGVA
jgi:hypothetical protein